MYNFRYFLFVYLWIHKLQIYYMPHQYDERTLFADVVWDGIWLFQGGNLPWEIPHGPKDQELDIVPTTTAIRDANT